MAAGAETFARDSRQPLKILLTQYGKIYKLFMRIPLHIENRLQGKLAVGVNSFQQLSCPVPNALTDFTARELLEIRAAHNNALPPGYSYSRQLYKSFHIDPTKHRPSSEALWRRLRDRRDFPDVNPPVNLTNLLSLKYQICYGLYDLERINGDIVILLGDETDSYKGIRKEILDFKGKIVLRDNQGAFGNPSADSLRASVDEDSRDILQVLFFHPADLLKERILAETAAQFKRLFTIADVRSFLI